MLFTSFVFSVLPLASSGRPYVIGDQFCPCATVCNKSKRELRNMVLGSLYGKKRMYLLVSHVVGNQFDFINLAQRDVGVQNDFLSWVHRLSQGATVWTIDLGRPIGQTKVVGTMTTGIPQRNRRLGR